MATMFGEVQVARGAAPAVDAPTDEVEPWRGAPPVRARGAAPTLPDYLVETYWWAYVHPNAVRVFERPWLVNAILWGNYARLRDAGLNALGATLPGRTLQIACAYGDFTPSLATRVARGGGELDVIDAAPAQIDNLRRKLPPDAPARAQLMDSAALDYPDGRFDRAVLFFLLHEQPASWRRATLAQAWRVVRPGGQIVIVDYARPRAWHPLRYLFPPVLKWLEPFALDLWREDLTTWAPDQARARLTSRSEAFGGLYQILTFER